jgi:cysteine desulfurase
MIQLTESALNAVRTAISRADAPIEKAGIAASSGSACASGSTEPSHVLRAMKAPCTSALGAIRFFFSHENTSDDVARVLDVLPAIVEKAREFSGFAADQSGEVRLGAAFS